MDTASLARDVSNGRLHPVEPLPLPEGARLITPIKMKVGTWVEMTYDAYLEHRGLTWVRAQGGFSPTRRRNLDFERQFTLLAAKGVADPTALIEHSEARAGSLSGPYVPDPMLVQGGKDLRREARRTRGR